jgi:hypothetical protein
VQNVTFYNLTIIASSNIVSKDYRPEGLFRISSESGSQVCQQQLLISNLIVRHMNYNATAALKNFEGIPIPSSSVITVDYSGVFQVNLTNSFFQNIFAYQGPAIAVTSIEPPNTS